MSKVEQITTALFAYPTACAASKQGQRVTIFAGASTYFITVEEGSRVVTALEQQSRDWPSPLAAVIRLLKNASAAQQENARHQRSGYGDGGAALTRNLGKRRS